MRFKFLDLTQYGPLLSWIWSFVEKLQNEILLVNQEIE